MMTKRTLSMVLIFVLVLMSIPMSVSADNSDLGMRRLGSGESYSQMSTSQSMLDMIKDMEGFSAEPYWDVEQWSIGYGTACGYDSSKKPDMIVTREEAETMLRNELNEKYGKVVNKYCASIGRQPSQRQFDALLDFTYNVGSGWIYGCQLTRWLENPTTEMDFVNAIGRWARVGGQVTYSTAMRRVREAIVFMKGEYYLTYGNGGFATDLYVVNNGNLPYYRAVIFQANGGSIGSLSDDVRYYAAGSTYDSFVTPERSGYIFKGWQVTRQNYAKVSSPYAISVGAAVEKNLHVSAVWEAIPVETEPTEPAPETTVPETTEPEETAPETTAPEVTVPETTAPTEPVPETTVPETTEPEETVPETTVPKETQPKPTEPKPTEPEVTEPKPTEPKSTEPKPTEPKPTEPKPTEPKPTEPKPTEPKETEPKKDKEEEEDTDSDEEASDVLLPFLDVMAEVWYCEPHEYATSGENLFGIGDTAFGASQSVSRGMLVTVLHRIAGAPAVSEEQLDCFRDVGSGTYYSQAVAWAKEYGIVNGTSADAFSPNATVTRQEALTIFHRFYVNYLMRDGSSEGNLSDFADGESVSLYARSALNWAVETGIECGSESADGLKLNPKNNLTRADASEMIGALVNLMGESE